MFTALFTPSKHTVSAAGFELVNVFRGKLPHSFLKNSIQKLIAVA